MPLTLYKILDIGDLERTRMRLQMADGSVKYPEGVVKNVIVKVKDFMIPVDFVVLNMKENK